MTMRISIAVRFLLAMLFALLASAALAVFLPTQAHADIVNGQGTMTVGNDRDYEFTLSEATDVDLTLSGTVTDEWSRVNAAVVAYTSYGQKVLTDVLVVRQGRPEDADYKTCLPAGKYYVKVQARNSTTVDQFYRVSYKFSLSARNTSVSFKKPTRTFSVPASSNATPGTIDFTYDSTSSYFYYRHNIANSKSQVAEVWVGDYESGQGYLKIQPKKLGKTVVTLNLGSKQAKCTVHVTKKTVNVAAGKKVKLAKPIGIGKVSFKSSNKKVVTTTKAGKITAKKAGKAKVYVKKGGVTYTYNVVVKKSSKLKAA